jgi:hypothetical protein
MLVICVAIVVVVRLRMEVLLLSLFNVCGQRGSSLSAAVMFCVVGIHTDAARAFVSEDRGKLCFCNNSGEGDVMSTEARFDLLPKRDHRFLLDARCVDGVTGADWGVEVVDLFTHENGDCGCELVAWSKPRGGGLIGGVTEPDGSDETAIMGHVTEDKCVPARAHNRRRTL